MKTSPDIDIQFEVFVQELPADYQAMAYEFKAFCRSRKVQSVYGLLQLVMSYCGLDFSLRTTAGQFSSANGYLSDTAVRKRLAACVPWVKAILTKVFNSALTHNPMRPENQSIQRIALLQEKFHCTSI